MRISLSLFGKSLAAILLVAGLGQAARAQEKIPMAAAPAAPVILTSANCGQGGCCDSGCDSCKQGGFVAGLEIPILKVFQSENGVPDYGYHASIRFWAGYEGAAGLGARIRYFEFSNDSHSDAGNFVDIECWDLEVTQRLHVCNNLDLLLSAGLRNLQYSARSFDVVDLNCVGPVVGIEATRSIGDSLALFALARGSILVASGSLDGDRVEDVTGSVYEIQLGAQAQRHVGNAIVYGRLAWEAQIYHALDDDDSESLSLMGITFGVGISR